MLTTIGLLGVAPLAVWLLGSAIVRVVPPVYRSEALLRLPAAGEARLADPLRTPAVIDAAARALATDGLPDPMSRHMLSTHLTVQHGTGPGMIKVAASGSDPTEAKRTLMAVIESYEHHHAGERQRLLVYAVPQETQPVGVPHGMRMVLGCAGLASLGLLLSIPLLRLLETVSATAPASAATGSRHGGGYLPAAQPAG